MSSSVWFGMRPIPYRWSIARSLQRILSPRRTKPFTSLMTHEGLPRGHFSCHSPCSSLRGRRTAWEAAGQGQREGREGVCERDAAEDEGARGGW